MYFNCYGSGIRVICYATDLRVHITLEDMTGTGGLKKLHGTFKNVTATHLKELHITLENMVGIGGLKKLHVTLKDVTNRERN